MKKFSSNFMEFQPSVSSEISQSESTDFEKLSDKELYKYCKEVGFNARIWSRKFIAAIPEVAKRRLYKKYGYGSVHEFAAKLAGVSKANVDDVLRVNEKLKELPRMKALIGEVGLNKVRLVANIAKPETENFWAEKIQNMTKSSLRIYINENFRSGTEGVKNTKIAHTEGQIGMFDLETFRSQQADASIGGGGVTGEENLFQTRSGFQSKTDSDSGMDSGSGADSRSAIFLKNKKTFTIHIDDETEFELRKFKQQLEKEKKEPVDWNLTLKEMVRRVGSENKVRPTKAIKSATRCGTRTSHCEGRAEEARTQPDTETQQNVKHKSRSNPRITRHIPAKIKRALEQKHNGRCGYRGCNKPAEQIHHPIRFAEKPNHENLVPLCKEHHDFVHQAGADGNLVSLCKEHHDFVHQANIGENLIPLRKPRHNFVHQPNKIGRNLIPLRKPRHNFVHQPNKIGRNLIPLRKPNHDFVHQPNKIGRNLIPLRKPNHDFIHEISIDKIFNQFKSEAACSCRE